ncbi:hypothetical protein GCM10011348_20860 [Marinobacterium nitratireducens]|uniref:Uncharacterized protein n=1 Tax=Marinobacterium nitratireducens TaxID=518897 RepID=A0A918DTF0_9GAMM|nr:hypothetical protein GCM10011348_20860 [Marinobacterium nitratireducens]
MGLTAKGTKLKSGIPFNGGVTHQKLQPARHTKGRSDLNYDWLDRVWVSALSIIDEAFFIQTLAR